MQYWRVVRASTRRAVEDRLMRARVNFILGGEIMLAFAAEVSGCVVLRRWGRGYAVLFTRLCANIGIVDTTSKSFDTGLQFFDSTQNPLISP